jgi:DNA uptake protein ComE-like DNA-binding protein
MTVKNKMNEKRSHFRLNNRQRNGIFFLIIIIISLQLVYHFSGFSSKDTVEINTVPIQKFQKKLDSLKKERLHTKQKIFPFNPNYLTDYKAYMLGMNLEETDKLFAFRKEGKFISSAREFQAVTGISDSLLNVLTPYFKFPEWVNKKKKNSPKEKRSKVKYDLNLATAQDLKQINGVGEKLSKRIISYRDLLKGFTFNDQIYEVYYLEKETADRILEEFEVKDKPHIDKLNINTATFKEVLHLPYIDYDLTKRIFRFRNQTNGLNSLEDLKKIDSFPIEKFNRISLYLKVE